MVSPSEFTKAAACEELYLTEVQQTVEGGDAFFPPYEDEFERIETLEENSEFIVRKWKRKKRAADRSSF